jgi:DNA-binding LytR/AlgR family response regulator
MIVAIDRIKEMKPLPNGDAMLQLHDGHELRMSRRYRDAVVRGWGGGKLAD